MRAWRAMAFDYQIRDFMSPMKQRTYLSTRIPCTAKPACPACLPVRSSLSAPTGSGRAFDPAGRPFGKERFRRILRSSAALPAIAIVQAVFKELADFTRGFPTEDDITLVVIKIQPQ